MYVCVCVNLPHRQHTVFPLETSVHWCFIGKWLLFIPRNIGSNNVWAERSDGMCGSHWNTCRKSAKRFWSYKRTHEMYCRLIIHVKPCVTGFFTFDVCIRNSYLNEFISKRKIRFNHRTSLLSFLGLPFLRILVCVEGRCSTYRIRWHMRARGRNFFWWTSSTY
jgi:hypothetical protein